MIPHMFPKMLMSFLNKALHPNVPYIKHRNIRCQILYLNKKLFLLEDTKKLFVKAQNATFGEYVDLEEHQKAINELMSLTYENYYKDTLENTGLNEDQLNYALVLNNNNLGKKA